MILVPVFSISFISCKEVMMLKYGIHQPREETPESVGAFMEKMEYPNENTFIFKDSSAFYSCLRDSVFRSNLLGTLFFSPRGLLDNYKDTSRCHLKHDTIYHVDTGYTLQNLMGFIAPLNEQTRIDTADADYIVVITWATFLGKYNERLFSIREVIGENNEVTVKPLFLCIDIQEEWDFTDTEQDRLKFE